MRTAYRAAGYEVEIRVPKYGKDWNAQLQYKLTGVLEEVKKPQKKENPTQKEEIKPMANLGKLVSDKTAADTQWREQRQADKETASALRDASVTQITDDPEKFARYLELQPVFLLEKRAVEHFITQQDGLCDSIICRAGEHRYRCYNP